MSRASLRDAAAIASTICQIVKGVVLSPNGAAKTTTSGPAPPWPTQALKTAGTTHVGGTVSTSPTHEAPSPDLNQTAGSSRNTPSSASRPWPSKASKVGTTLAEATNHRPVPTVVEPSAAGEAPEDATPTSGMVSSPETTPPKQEFTLGAVAAETQPTPPNVKADSDPAKGQATSPGVEDTAAFDVVHQATPVAHSSAKEHASLNTQHVPSLTKIQADLPPIGSPVVPADFEEYDAVTESKHTPLRAAKVPSSRLGRLFHYGGLGAGLALGAAGSLFRGASSGGADGAAPNSLFMSEQNVARLVDKLSTMRGAALKLGQFLSIQETRLLPPQIEQVLLRVQNSANYMPVWQLNKVMSQELGGADWREHHFKEFDDIPFASASIGQVHCAVLRDDFPDPQMAGKKVAVKVQFPGVLESIDSDLSYLRWLVSASALLPKGLFLENTLRVLGRELKDECDYKREAEMGRRFRTILHDSSEFEVPKVVDSLCTGKVLTTEMMRGRPLSMALRYPQDVRDRIAQSILNLSLSELFRFRLMQTDPNWSNFLYDERTGKIQLIDFGATREYSKEFMDNWLQMLQAAIAGDYDQCLIWSKRVGYLTGEESAGMERAHVESMIALGEPFRPDAPNPYPFEHQTITDRVKAQIPLMLRERLTPPPQETYSLNRKLSGAFLLCARLKAHVNCRTLFENVEAEYHFGPAGPVDASASTCASTQASSNGAQATSPLRSSEQRRHFHSAFRTAFQREQRTSEQRKHGRNLADRFPRTKVAISGDAGVSAGVSAGSHEVGDIVESLASNPTGSTSMQETPGNATESESKASLDVSRSATPAEVTTLATGASSAAGSEDAQPSMGPITIRGIVIPLKPPPPGPEECCMSGCAHCTYDIYAEDLQDYHSRLASARMQLTQMSPPVTPEEWRQDLLGDYPYASDGAGAPVSQADMRERAERDVDRVISDLDPTMRAFLEMERKLKKQERQRTEQA